MKTAKIRIGMILLAVIVLGIFSAVYFTAVSPGGTFQFAGFTWQDVEKYQFGSSTCNKGSGSIDIVNDFVEIKGTGNGAGIDKRMMAEITGIDELLIIYEGSIYGYCSGASGNGGGGIGAIVSGSDGGSIEAGKSAGTSTCPFSSQQISVAYPPSIWKFKNNFDGTWSTLESLGVGDIFIVKQTQQISGSRQYLSIGISAVNCADSSTGGSSRIKVYNVVRKENAFAVCKADKYSYDANLDGKIASDGSECFDLSTIVLNSEEAIKESFDEKLRRITLELEAKNMGLQTDIAELQQKLASQQGYDDAAIRQQITAIQQELELAKKTLADVQAGDRNVIAVVEAQEQFKPSGSISNFFNKIIAWIKGLFK